MLEMEYAWIMNQLGGQDAETALHRSVCKSIDITHRRCFFFFFFPILRSKSGRSTNAH
jgi:hypothetical protein